MEIHPDVIKAVANDVRQSYPEMTDAEAIEHVVDTVTYDGIDGNDFLAEAYRTIIRAYWDNPAELTEALQ